MPDMGTIATTLTVNSAPAQKGFTSYNQGLASLQRSTVAFNSAGRNMSFAILEVGRAAEDAAVGFGLNGLQGAVRGSLNNLTTMATVLGGPVAGAIAGVTAAGTSLLVNYFTKEEKAVKQSTDAYKQYADALRDSASEKQRIEQFNKGLPGMEAGDLNEERAKRADRLVELRDLDMKLRGELGRLHVPPGANGPLNQLQMQAQRFGPMAAGMPLFGVGGGGPVDPEIAKLQDEQAKLLREQVQINFEIAQLEAEAQKDLDKAVRDWRAEMEEARAERDRAAIEERKKRFFDDNSFFEQAKFEREFGRGLKTLGGVPSTAAATFGSSAAASAIARAVNNNGVEQKQLAEQKESKEILKRIAKNLPIPVIARF